MFTGDESSVDDSFSVYIKNRERRCEIMAGGITMIAMKSNLFSVLSDDNKNAINDFIEFLYHKQNAIETKNAIKDALEGNTVGPFDTVDDFLKELYAED